jgi:hypothetical protein
MWNQCLERLSRDRLNQDREGRVQRCGVADRIGQPWQHMRSSSVGAPGASRS